MMAAARARQVVSPEWGAAVSEYKAYLVRQGFSEESVVGYGKRATRVARFMTARDAGPSQLDTAVLSDYWAACGEEMAHSTMRLIRACLVSFLGFLGERGYSDDGLAKSLPSVVGRVTRIRRPYSDDEIRAALDAIDLSKPPGKRDYAMILLGSSAALRAHDIIRMRVSDIDWEREEITLLQHKARKLRTIPMGAELGNAILDYIVDERPGSSCPYLFLSTREPHGGLAASSVAAGMLRRRLGAAGVDVSGRSTGFHAFRVRAASRLLEEGVPLSNISDFLGHGNPSSVKHYIAVDEEGMRSCCLSLDGIGGL